jgi:hypothetical protein
MSSSTRRDRRAVRAAALFLVAVLVPGFTAPAFAAPISLQVVATLPGDGQTALVVDLSASSGPVARSAATVAVNGTPQPARLEPVVSDLMTVTLVVDTSAAGSATLSSWLSAATRFVLETPTGTQTAAIADTSPPTVISQPQRGPVGIVGALSGVHAGGQRKTSDALTLAMGQFPGTPVGRRVVVLYTTAPDAGGESATDLGGRFRRAGTILVVVGTSITPYWGTAARATGGFFAPTRTPVVVPALDQVDTTLRGRYLVLFPTPRTLPAQAEVRIDLAGLSLAAKALVQAEAVPASAAAGSPGVRTLLVVAVILAVLLVIVALALVLRRRPAAPAPPAGTVSRTEPVPIARGRASVPLAIGSGQDFTSVAIARGRAAVPYAIGPPRVPPALPAAPHRPDPQAPAEAPGTAGPQPDGTPTDDAAQPAPPSVPLPRSDSAGPPWR